MGMTENVTAAKHFANPFVIPPIREKTNRSISASVAVDSSPCICDQRRMRFSPRPHVTRLMLRPSTERPNLLEFQQTLAPRNHFLKLRDDDAMLAVGRPEMVQAEFFVVREESTRQA